MGRGKLWKVVYRRHVSETGEQSAKCVEGKGREDEGGRRRRKKKKGCVDLDAREKHHLSLTLCVSSLPLKAFLVLSRTVSFRIG